MIPRYPHVCGYRLVAAPKEQQRLLSTDRFQPGSAHCLQATACSAVQDGIPAAVFVEPWWIKYRLYTEVPLGKAPFQPIFIPFLVKENIVED
jgi:hypothetical protein